MRRVTKIVFVASDGTEHATEADCEHWERYSTIRNLLEDADFDWRDGSASEPRKELAMFVPLSDFRRVEERALNAELQVEHWMNKANAYQELMDATAQDADRAYELLRRCETEMRYAGWNRLLTDNYARKDIYDDIKEFLK